MVTSWPQTRHGRVHRNIDVADPYHNEAPIIFTGWSLSYEIFFYLMFAIPLALRRSVPRILTPILILLGVIGFFSTPSWQGIASLINPRLLEFLAGVLIGVAVLKRRQLYPRVSGVLAGIGVLALIVPVHSITNLNLIWWGIPSFFIVLAIVASEQRLRDKWPRWLLLMGDSSYSIYLSHTMLFLLLEKLMVRAYLLHPGDTSCALEWAIVAITLVCSGLFGLLIYYVLEKPLTNQLRLRLLHEGKPAAQKVGVEA